MKPRSREPNYIAASGSLLIPAHTDSATIPVEIPGSTIYQAASTFQMLLLGGGSGIFNPSFARQQPFITGGQPAAVVAADVNGDGQLDLIVANSSDNTVSVLLNSTPLGASTPRFAPPQSFAVGNGPFAMAVADVNGDGLPDVIVTNFLDDTVSGAAEHHFPGRQHGQLRYPADFCHRPQPGLVTARDVNGDGRSDLIVANEGDNTLSVLLNTTTPGATKASFDGQQTFKTGTNPESVTAADLNGDGKADLIAANFSDNTLSVLLEHHESGLQQGQLRRSADFCHRNQPGVGGGGGH